MCQVVEKFPLEIRHMMPQMRREVKVQSGLHHPNILRLHEVFEERQSCVDSGPNLHYKAQDKGDSRNHGL